VFDLDVAALAATQCGAFARFQVLALDGYDAQIGRRIRAGRWIRLAPGVYGLPGHRDSWARRLWVVYLAAGEVAVVSHESAVAPYRLTGIPRDVLAVTVPHPQHLRVAGATVHQTRHLPDHHWVNIAGRRTTTLARSLVDLAATTSKARLDRAYEDALLTDHLTHARMTRTFAELLRPGRKGMTKLASILDERGPGFVPAASELEHRLFETCALVGLTPVRQFPLPSRGEISGFVDAALIDARLILEADGRRWHDRIATQRRDRARVKAAARLGWQTLQFGWDELVEDPEGEARSIRETYDLRLHQLAAWPGLIGGSASRLP
jgi:very-short-patch-repair endonuclease